MRFSTIQTLTSTVVLLALSACGPVEFTGLDKTPGAIDNDKPLGNYETIVTGPGADGPAYDGPKMALPVRYDDLVQFNSPVKSQGSRGVCSIFSTVGLMEHLYVKEGTWTSKGLTPDFSEQFLQWSAKFEVNSFPNSSGSNAYYNLRSISSYGVVLEADDPYETFQWSGLNDADCADKPLPTKCYTNGTPSDDALSAERYHLPSGQYLSSYSVKDYLAGEELGVVVGLSFYYQAWNHRKSDLETNTDYWRSGYVTYPNEADIEFSEQEDMRAGHSILILGWDDDLEVPKRDGDGNVITDGNGNVVREKGFYIFKNSWGTDSFGVNNDNGAGYGYISQKYVRDYGRVRTAALPTAPVKVPNLGGNGEIVTYQGEGNMLIPDNDSTGIKSMISVPDSGTVMALQVNLDIEHTWRGDLLVTLSHDGEMVTLHNRTGGSEHDLVTSFTVPELVGADLNGDWTLKVSDNAGDDVGSLRSWSLEIEK